VCYNETLCQTWVAQFFSPKVARNNIVVVENVDDFGDKFTCDVSVNFELPILWM
jgi:hypothetical protein